MEAAPGPGSGRRAILPHFFKVRPLPRFTKKGTEWLPDAQMLSNSKISPDSCYLEKGVKKNWRQQLLRGPLSRDC